MTLPFGPVPVTADRSTLLSSAIVLAIGLTNYLSPLALDVGAAGVGAAAAGVAGAAGAA